MLFLMLLPATVTHEQVLESKLERHKQLLLAEFDEIERSQP